jgi:hypothetical protein
MTAFKPRSNNKHLLHVICSLYNSRLFFGSVVQRHFELFSKYVLNCKVTFTLLKFLFCDGFVYACLVSHTVEPTYGKNLLLSYGKI